MPTIEFSISRDLTERMKKYQETNWEQVAKGAVEKYLEKLEVTDKLTVKNNFTLQDADELGGESERKNVGEA